MSKRRGKGPLAIAAMVPGLTKTARVKRGLMETRILTDWSAIVGEQLAAESVPLKLTYARSGKREGILHLKVSGAFAPQIQHLEPIVIERINAHFGYRAVGRLHLVHGTITRRRVRPRRVPAPPDKAQESWLDERLQRIRDPALRDAFNQLGRGIIKKGDTAPDRKSQRTG